MNLSESQRREVLDAIFRALGTKLATPNARPDLAAMRATHEGAVLRMSDAEGFENSVNAMLKDLRLSRVGFFHEAKPRAAGRIAIAATFLKAETPDGMRWMFQDVHPGGLAAKAAIEPGDVLLTLNGIELRPPELPTLEFGRRHALVIRDRRGTTRETDIDVPLSSDQKRPLIVPDQVVSAHRLQGNVAHIRVSMFPGVLGMHVARDLSKAIADFDCPRVVFDLRGNSGGGIGCLRLMSLLCPDRRGVGYTIGRKQMASGFAKERLPQFDLIPASKLQVIPLAFRFALAGRSVAVFSENLGAKKHHGRCVILQNEHSASASEMALAFAEEYRLATLVGTRTPGRVVGASSVKVGYGYRLALPVAAYFTWADRNLEGVGVAPTIDESIQPEALQSGMDTQLARAVEVVTQL
ncbi:MAG: S41 family peptidase [Bryobacteraceae bacterium]|nr:S41 family peptidase [Bryobacteraceae bacterium]